MAAEKAGWNKRKPGKGRGLGIAAQRYSFTYVASVVEVEVTEKGEIQIPRVDTAVDAGTAVNPAIFPFPLSHVPPHGALLPMFYLAAGTFRRFRRFEFASVYHNGSNQEDHT